MVPETAFRSEERFTQRQFRTWLTHRAASDVNRYELIDGQIVMEPPAGWPHGRIESKLVRWLEEHVETNRLGIVQGSSAGYELPSGDTVEPDVSFVSHQRLGHGPQPQRGRFLKVVPNLVVEILSASTARRDRLEKPGIYARNGVDEYWLVDERNHTATVYRLGASGYTNSTSRKGTVRSTILPHLRISVARLFELIAK